MWAAIVLIIHIHVDARITYLHFRTFQKEKYVGKEEEAFSTHGLRESLCFF